MKSPLSFSRVSKIRLPVCVCLFVCWCVCLSSVYAFAVTHVSGARDDDNEIGQRRRKDAER